MSTDNEKPREVVVREIRRASVQAARAGRTGKRAVNMREYLNAAASQAHALLEKLRPVIEASPDGVLDKDARDTFRLAMEGLKTVRELQLKAKAVDHAIKQSIQEPGGGGFAELPALKSIASSQLVQLASSDSAEVSKKETGKKKP